jgi:hypothetical protein
VETVREALLGLVKKNRIGTVLALLSFGSLPADLCRKSTDLYAREVVPYVREHGEAFLTQAIPGAAAGAGGA